eukprot:TRINITY_DN661_c0_g1_i3.p2 TRINITY_DN661_c0_g1~~TRINITY_DN661_c0_g1_i3.p2  ORF type:complete len:106 (+),score=22.42 TRINITY_DN661_c0_g1_i3:911-1228(+)
MLELIEAQGTSIHKFAEISFAAAFSVLRVFIGFTVTYFWVREMVYLVTSGTAHSNGVLYYYLGGAIILSALQIYWFFVIVQAALGGAKSTDARKETLEVTKTKKQ